MATPTTTRDLAGRTIMVTGANTGIGRVSAEVLARRGARVFLAGRSREKTLPVRDAIRAAGGTAEYLALDLADLASTARSAREFLALGEPLHVLLNNAGLASAPGTTRDGFEMMFGTNHLGPFLLTVLLLPRLRESGPGVRIVNVASRAHYNPKGIDFDALRRPTRTFAGFREYGVSKLANVLFTRELAAGRAGAGVHSYALHPGVVASDVWRRVPWPVRPLIMRRMLTVEQGARTSLYCATAPEIADHDGRYYDDCMEREPSAVAQDPALARALWDKSEEWTAPFR